MDVELKKDIVLFTRYIRRLAVKHPEAYIAGRTYTDTTIADVALLKHKHKKHEKLHYSRCRIAETGEMKFTE